MADGSESGQGVKLDFLTPPLSNTTQEGQLPAGRESDLHRFLSLNT